MVALRSSIDRKRKMLFSEDHTLKPFAGDELVYLEGTQRLITMLHEELQSASNKLTTTHINLLKKFPFCTKKSSTSRRQKENRRKVRKTKEKRFKQRALQLLVNLTSVEVAGKIFDSVEENDTTVIPVESINADFSKKLTRRLHLDPLLWLLENLIFNTTLANNLEQVAAILRSQSPGSTDGDANEVAESDDEAPEGNEVVESDDEAPEGKEVVE